MLCTMYQHLTTITCHVYFIKSHLSFVVQSSVVHCTLSRNIFNDKMFFLLFTKSNCTFSIKPIVDN